MLCENQTSSYEVYTSMKLPRMLKKKKKKKKLNMVTLFRHFQGGMRLNTFQTKNIILDSLYETVS